MFELVVLAFAIFLIAQVCNSAGAWFEGKKEADRLFMEDRWNLSREAHRLNEEYAQILKREQEIEARQPKTLTLEEVYAMNKAVKKKKRRKRLET